jgi:copper chaperone NosL
MTHRNLTGLLTTALLATMVLAGCGSREIRPVDLYPEDMCAACRMAISDPRFASEIIEQDGTVHKFDDLGCLIKFREKGKAGASAVIFLKDYETLAWVPYEKSTIVETGITTPMASGRVAFASSERAGAFARANPPRELAAGCCSDCE